MSESLRVLCVDDEPSVVELTAEYLTRELDGWEVVTATGVEGALAVLEHERVDCVVSDYDMPDANGLELLRAVRERAPDLPFVLFTGKGSEEVASEAISAGVTDYLQKAGPERFELLANRVENAVGQYRAERNLAATRARLEQLHGTALDLRDAEDRATVHDLAVEAADEILSFDVCGLFELQAGSFRPVATRNFPDDYEPLDRDEGIAGRTYRTGESVLLDDIETAEDAASRGGRVRACLSVPVGDHGVFQAVSREVGAFEERDRELAELLVAHVAGALDRIASEAELERTTVRLETVLEHAPAHVYIKDLDGRYTLVNDAFADRLGLAREEIVGRTDDELQPGAVAEEVRANDRLAVERREPVEVEETARWDDEEHVYYSVKAPVLDADGEPTGVCGVSSDITALKANQRELRRKTERLEAFAAVVSHDLRNPLSVAKGYAELLADGEFDGREQVVEHAGEVEASLARTTEIIEDLLALAREGEVVGDTEPVAVDAVAEDAWAAVDTADATATVDADRTVEADASRLCEAFENLFRNAVEHGGPDVAVRVEGTDDGFAVTDDGAGFADDDPAPGEVTAPGVSSKSDGTGVGLAIVERIAEGHGWELTVRDGEDGARFEFST